MGAVAPGATFVDCLLISGALNPARLSDGRCHAFGCFRVLGLELPDVVLEEDLSVHVAHARGDAERHAALREGLARRVREDTDQTIRCACCSARILWLLGFLMRSAGGGGRWYRW